MKKYLKIIGIGLGIIIIICSFFVYKYINYNPNIERSLMVHSPLELQYKSLEDKCKTIEIGKEDCLESVRIMRKNNYSPAGKNGCPEGFFMNGLDCIGCEDANWCEPINTDNTVKKVKSHNYFSTSFSVSGMSNEIFLSDDKTFIKKNTNDMMSEPPCEEGKISDEDYNYFWKLVESSNFFEKKFSEEETDDVLCQGSSHMEASFNAKKNSISPPCNFEDNQNNVDIINMEEKLSNELEKIVKKSNPKTCKKGIYMTTLHLGKCKEYLESKWNKSTKFEKYNIDSLDIYLKKSLSYIKRDIYIGKSIKDAEKYHRKYYQIGEECYFVLLSKFNWWKFKSYDEILDY